jgi:hypothetical protein
LLRHSPEKQFRILIFFVFFFVLSDECPSGHWSGSMLFMLLLRMILGFWSVVPEVSMKPQSDGAGDAVLTLEASVEAATDKRLHLDTTCRMDGKRDTFDLLPLGLETLITVWISEEEVAGRRFGSLLIDG